jgi:ATP-binding cassette subfamily F protein 3
MIHLSNLSKQFGGQILYRNASIQINPGDRIGLVGPNGAGKTTVFRVIVGEEGVDSGTISISNKIKIGYFSQSTGDMRGVSALEAVMGAAGPVTEVGKRLHEIEQKLEDSAVNPIADDVMEKLLERYGEYQHQFEEMGGYDIETRAKEILTGLGVFPEDHNRPVESFSGGWKMRIALAKILILNPDALLMDEPTNYLDVESIVWLEEWLTNFKGALVMTSHDRDFMNRTIKTIAEVANKTITTYTGNYDFYERERGIRAEQLVAAHRRQQDMLAKEEEFIARFAARASHAAQVQSRVKKLEKIDRIEIPAEQKTIHFSFPKCPRSGDDVVKLEGVAKVWPARDDSSEKCVFSGITGMVRRLERIAVVGVNGAGKSTLLKVICGQTDPSEGKVTLGSNVRVGYFSQHALDILDSGKTIFEEVHDRIPDATVGYVRSLLGAFLFSGEEADKKISVLSGGEKSRVVLATILASPVNLLILDEPTNHLDIKSREVLEEAIKSFEGTVMVVSHDRYFLRAVTTRVLEVDHGKLTAYDGDYEYYMQKRTKK